MRLLLIASSCMWSPLCMLRKARRVPLPCPLRTQLA